MEKKKDGKWQKEKQPKTKEQFALICTDQASHKYCEIN